MRAREHVAAVANVGSEQFWVSLAQAIFDDPVLDKGLACFHARGKWLQQFVGDSLGCVVVVEHCCLGSDPIVGAGAVVSGAAGVREHVVRQSLPADVVGAEALRAGHDHLHIMREATDKQRRYPAERGAEWAVVVDCRLAGPRPPAR